MSTLRPKFITFDCYGTLTHFQMPEVTTEIYGSVLDAPELKQFIKNFAANRMDEILGAWKPYNEVLHNALERTCRRNGVTFRAEDALRVYDTVPSWGPHADVPDGLARVAKEIPLVGLSNAMDDNAYKPQMQAFEFMFDMLGCGPEDVLHCSSSFRYDLMTAHDIGIKNKAWINRGHEPANPFYEYQEIKDISGLPALVGL